MALPREPVPYDPAMARDLSRVDPDLRAALRRFPPITFGPVTTRIMRTLGGVMRQPVESHGLDSSRLAVPATGLPAWVHRRSDDRRPALFWLHGGGHIIGDPEQRQWAAALTERADCVVVSAGYRLSPEHPFPASLDDAHAAFHWMRASADDLGLDPSRIVVGGESAGGGLAASLVQRLVDEGTAVAGQLLVYPMLDDRTAARSDIGPKDHLGWNNRSNAYGWSSFLGHPPGAATTPPYAVPARREDLAGLPTTWIGVGDLDLFLDEDTRYAARLRAAGVEVEFVQLEGAPHAFVSIDPSAPISTNFFDAAGAFARQRLHG